MNTYLLKLNTPLSIDEIDFRIQSINKGGYATILAYKDARADMKRLDEVYGVEGWQRKHEVINDKEFCHVGVWSKQLSQWVWKSDCGTESSTEKEKGESSDAFKRACFNFGIGRELYEYPQIQIKLNQNEFEVTGDRVKQTYNLKLKEWKWESLFNGNKIVHLSAKDEAGKQRFVWNYATTKTTLHNHVPLGTDEKPLISNAHFKVFSERIKNGEAGLYKKVIETYSLEPAQKRILDQLHNESLKQTA